MSQRTIVLTGASRGIGHATVKRFSSEGWRVLTCSRKPFDERCPWPGGEENHIQVDLSDPNSTIAAIPIIKEKVPVEYHQACKSILLAAALTYVIGVFRSFFSLRFIWLLITRMR